MLISLDENGKNCWVTGIRENLCKTGFYFVWLQQGVGDVKSFLCIFKQRLLDMFTQEWTADIRDNQVTYGCFNNFLKQKGICQALIYIVLEQRLCNSRLGVHPINDNMYGYSDCPTHRNCVFCPDVVENEDHFLLVCLLYTDLRNRFLEQKGAQSLHSLLFFSPFFHFLLMLVMILLCVIDVI